jgi:hypothetical protein
VGVFFRREVVLGNQLWGDGGFGHFNSKSKFQNFQIPALESHKILLIIQGF